MVYRFTDLAVPALPAFLSFVFHRRMWDGLRGIYVCSKEVSVVCLYPVDQGSFAKIYIISLKKLSAWPHHGERTHSIIDGLFSVPKNLIHKLDVHISSCLDESGNSSFSAKMKTHLNHFLLYWAKSIQALIIVWERLRAENEAWRHTEYKKRWWQAVWDGCVIWSFQWEGERLAIREVCCVRFYFIRNTAPYVWYHLPTPKPLCDLTPKIWQLMLWKCSSVFYSSLLETNL